CHLSCGSENCCRYLFSFSRPASIWPSWRAFFAWSPQGARFVAWMQCCSTRNSARAMMRSSCSRTISSPVDMLVAPISPACGADCRPRKVVASAQYQRRRDVESPPNAIPQELVRYLARESLRDNLLDNLSTKAPMRRLGHDRTSGLAPSHAETTPSTAARELPLHDNLSLRDRERSILGGVGR